MEWIEELNLILEKKWELKTLLSGSKIIDVEFIQNNIYLFLQNSKVIVFKNSTEEFYKKLEQIVKNDLSPKEINKRTNKRKADVWTIEEIEYLKYNYFCIDLNLLSIKLKKSQYQISLKAIEIGLVAPREWENAEVEYLKNNMEISNYELARILKRSISSIKARKRVLKIERRRGIKL